MVVLVMVMFASGAGFPFDQHRDLSIQMERGSRIETENLRIQRLSGKFWWRG